MYGIHLYIVRCSQLNFIINKVKVTDMVWLNYSKMNIISLKHRTLFVIYHVYSLPTVHNALRQIIESSNSPFHLKKTKINFLSNKLKSYKLINTYTLHILFKNHVTIHLLPDWVQTIKLIRIRDKLIIFRLPYNITKDCKCEDMNHFYSQLNRFHHSLKPRWSSSITWHRPTGVRRC